MEKNLKKNSFIEPCNDNCSFCFLNYADVLGENYLFRNLSPTEIGEVIKRVHHQVKQYSRGDLIAGSGEQYNSLLIVVQGAVVGELIDFEGRVLRIEELKAPETVASAFIFGQNNELPVNVTALADTKVLSIHRDELLNLFRENDRILHNYLDIMANRAQMLSKKLKLLSLHTIKGKIAHYLLDLSKKQDSGVLTLPNTQSEIADIFGTTRPSIGRAFRDMHNEGIIRAQGKRVEILNNKKLSALLKEH